MGAIEPYVVKEQPDAIIPVNSVHKENGMGGLRTIHHKNLLPIGFLPMLTVSGDKDDVSAEPSVQPPLAISATLTDSSRSTRDTDDAMSTSQIPVDLKVNVGSRVPSQGRYCCR